jgi:hypothetical protein
VIESQYTSNIHKKLPKDVYKWKVNDNYAGGVPDAFYRKLNGVGKPLWVEYKFLKKLPKRGNTMIIPDLSAQQLIWLKQARAAGEQAWVIIGCEEHQHKRNAVGVVLTDIDEWVTGITTDEYKARMQGMCYTAIAAQIHYTLT